MLIFGWLLFSIIVGAIGSGRNIGFLGAFFLSLILSPIIGLLITLFSKSKEDAKYQQDMLDSQKRIEANAGRGASVAELEKLARLKEQGHITQSEYEKMKAKLL
jgi:phosphate/sulfate permease